MNAEELARERALNWTKAPFDEETQMRAMAMIESGGENLVDAFYKDLEFGTGGMRGIMGVGTNRVNKYTLGLATQGLVNYIKQHFDGQPKVAIAYDCRNNSDSLARVVAEVMSANGVYVYLFESLRPTPELSFAVRHLDCQAGIVLTASHNPKEYNGYKVYWNDGGQLVPPHDNGVIDEVRAVSVANIRFEQVAGNIEIIGEEVDEAFHNAVLNKVGERSTRGDLKVVFTSIHGTSIKSIPHVLEQAGFTQTSIVEDQATPDGNFPTVISPNPEEAEALNLALVQADEEQADLVIGTDPDADRIGIAVRNPAGEMELLNGNQTAALLTHFMLDELHSKGELTPNAYIAETIVTTKLLERIASSFNVTTYHCLTGFKWIAAIIRELEGKEQFICGGEESYGFMIGDFVRDKDSVTAALIISDLAAKAKAEGSSIYDYLIEIYCKHGIYQEDLISLTKKGRSGAEEIKAMMTSFRQRTPNEIDGVKLKFTRDYLTQEVRDYYTNTSASIDLPKSNVFQMELEDETVITARPSGTEPKIKFYISVNSSLASPSEYPAAKAALLERIEGIKKALDLI